jgi:hypothetical protein
MDLWDFSREDWMVGGGGLCLIVALVAVPFYSFWVGAYPHDPAAVSAPGPIWGILALILALLVVGDWALATFRPGIFVPSTRYGREATRAKAAVAIVVLVLFKLILHTGYLGAGCLLDLVLVSVVAYGTRSIAQRAQLADSRQRVASTHKYDLHGEQIAEGRLVIVGGSTAAPRASRPGPRLRAIQSSNEEASWISQS